MARHSILDDVLLDLERSSRGWVPEEPDLTNQPPQIPQWQHLGQEFEGLASGSQESGDSGLAALEAPEQESLIRAQPEPPPPWYEDFFRSVLAGAEQQFSGAASMAQAYAGAPAAIEEPDYVPRTFTGQVGAAVGSSLPTLALPAIGFFAGGPIGAGIGAALGAGLMFLAEGWDAYQRELRRQQDSGGHLDKSEALAKASLYAAGSTAIELGTFRIGKLARLMRTAERAAASPVLRLTKSPALADLSARLASSTLENAVEESAQAALQDIVVEGRPTEQALQEGVIAAVAGPLIGAAGAGFRSAARLRGGTTEHDIVRLMRQQGLEGQANELRAEFAKIGEAAEKAQRLLDLASTPGEVLGVMSDANRERVLAGQTPLIATDDGAVDPAALVYSALKQADPDLKDSDRIPDVVRSRAHDLAGFSLRLLGLENFARRAGENGVRLMMSLYENEDSQTGEVSAEQGKPAQQQAEGAAPQGVAFGRGEDRPKPQAIRAPQIPKATVGKQAATRLRVPLAAIGGQQQPPGGQGRPSTHQQFRDIFGLPEAQAQREFERLKEQAAAIAKPAQTQQQAQAEQPPQPPSEQQAKTVWMESLVGHVDPDKGPNARFSRVLQKEDPEAQAVREAKKERETYLRSVAKPFEDRTAAHKALIEDLKRGSPITTIGRAAGVLKAKPLDDAITLLRVASGIRRTRGKTDTLFDVEIPLRQIDQAKAETFAAQIAELVNYVNEALDIYADSGLKSDTLNAHVSALRQLFEEAANLAADNQVKATLNQAAKRIVVAERKEESSTVRSQYAPWLYLESYPVLKGALWASFADVYARMKSAQDDASFAGLYRQLEAIFSLLVALETGARPTELSVSSATSQLGVTPLSMSDVAIYAFDSKDPAGSLHVGIKVPTAKDKDKITIRVTKVSRSILPFLILAADARATAEQRGVIPRDSNPIKYGKLGIDVYESPHKAPLLVERNPDRLAETLRELQRWVLAVGARGQKNHRNIQTLGHNIEIDGMYVPPAKVQNLRHLAIIGRRTGMAFLDSPNPLSERTGEPDPRIDAADAIISVVANQAGHTQKTENQYYADPAIGQLAEASPVWEHASDPESPFAIMREGTLAPGGLLDVIAEAVARGSRTRAADARQLLRYPKVIADVLVQFALDRQLFSNAVKRSLELVQAAAQAFPRTIEMLSGVPAAPAAEPQIEQAVQAAEQAVPAPEKTSQEEERAPERERVAERPAAEAEQTEEQIQEEPPQRAAETEPETEQRQEVEARQPEQQAVEPSRQAPQTQPIAARQSAGTAVPSGLPPEALLTQRAQVKGDIASVFDAAKSFGAVPLTTPEGGAFVWSVVPSDSVHAKDHVAALTVGAFIPLDQLERLVNRTVSAWQTRQRQSVTSQEAIHSMAANLRAHLLMQASSAATQGPPIIDLHEYELSSGQRSTPGVIAGNARSLAIIAAAQANNNGWSVYDGVLRSLAAMNGVQLDPAKKYAFVRLVVHYDVVGEASRPQSEIARSFMAAANPEQYGTAMTTVERAMTASVVIGGLVGDLKWTSEGQLTEDSLQRVVSYLRSHNVSVPLLADQTVDVAAIMDAIQAAFVAESLSGMVDDSDIASVLTHVLRADGLKRAVGSMLARVPAMRSATEMLRSAAAFDPGNVGRSETMSKADITPYAAAAIADLARLRAGKKKRAAHAEDHYKRQVSYLSAETMAEVLASYRTRQIGYIVAKNPNLLPAVLDEWLLWAREAAEEGVQQQLFGGMRDSEADAIIKAILSGKFDDAFEMSTRRALRKALSKPDAPATEEQIDKYIVDRDTSAPLSAFTDGLPMPVGYWDDEQVLVVNHGKGVDWEAFADSLDALDPDTFADRLEQLYPGNAVSAAMRQMQRVGLFRKLPGLKFAIAQDLRVEGAKGLYFPRRGLIALATGSMSNPEVAVHEVLHAVFDALSPLDRSYVRMLRIKAINRAIDDVLAKGGTPTESDAKRIQALLEISRNVDGHWLALETKDPELYHLVNDDEFFTWMLQSRMTERLMSLAESETERSILRRFVDWLRGILRDIAQWVRSFRAAYFGDLDEELEVARQRFVESIANGDFDVGPNPRDVAAGARRVLFSVALERAQRQAQDPDEDVTVGPTIESARRMLIASVREQLEGVLRELTSMARRISDSDWYDESRSIFKRLQAMGRTLQSIVDVRRLTRAGVLPRANSEAFAPALLRWAEQERNAGNLTDDQFEQIRTVASRYRSLVTALNANSRAKAFVTLVQKRDDARQRLQYLLRIRALQQTGDTSIGYVNLQDADLMRAAGIEVDEAAGKITFPPLENIEAAIRRAEEDLQTAQRNLDDWRSNIVPDPNRLVPDEVSPVAAMAEYLEKIGRPVPQPPDGDRFNPEYMAEVIREFIGARVQAITVKSRAVLAWKTARFLRYDPFLRELMRADTGGEQTIANVLALANSVAAVLLNDPKAANWPEQDKINVAIAFMSSAKQLLAKRSVAMAAYGERLEQIAQEMTAIAQKLSTKQFAADITDELARYIDLVAERTGTGVAGPFAVYFARVAGMLAQHRLTARELSELAVELLSDNAPAPNEGNAGAWFVRTVAAAIRDSYDRRGAARQLAGKTDNQLVGISDDAAAQLYAVIREQPAFADALVTLGMEANYSKLAAALLKKVAQRIEEKRKNGDMPTAADVAPLQTAVEMISDRLSVEASDLLDQLTSIIAEQKAILIATDVWKSIFGRDVPWDADPESGRGFWDLYRAAARIAGYAKDMVIVTSPGPALKSHAIVLKGFTLPGVGEIKDVVIEMNVSSIDPRLIEEVGRWLSYAQQYIAGYSQQNARYEAYLQTMMLTGESAPEQEQTVLTPEQLGYDATVYQGLKNSLAMHGPAINALFASDDGAPIPTWFKTIASKQFLRQFGNLARFAPPKVRDALVTWLYRWSSAYRAADAEASHYAPLITAARMVAMKSHGMNIEAVYRTLVWNPLASAARQHDVNIEPGMILSTGYRVTEEDIALLKLQHKMHMAILAAVSRVSGQTTEEAYEALIGVVQALPGGQYHRLHGRPGKLALPRHLSERGHRFVIQLHQLMRMVTGGAKYEEVFDEKLLDRLPSPNDEERAAFYVIIKAWDDAFDGYMMQSLLFDATRDRSDVAIRRSDLWLRVLRHVAERVKQQISRGERTYPVTFDGIVLLAEQVLQEMIEDGTASIPKKYTSAEHYARAMLWNDLLSYLKLAESELQKANTESGATLSGWAAGRTARTQFTLPANTLWMPSIAFDHGAFSDADIRFAVGRSVGYHLVQLSLAAQRALEHTEAVLHDAQTKDNSMSRKELDDMRRTRDALQYLVEGLNQYASRAFGAMLLRDPLVLKAVTSLILSSPTVIIRNMLLFPVLATINLVSLLRRIRALMMVGRLATLPVVQLGRLVADMASSGLRFFARTLDYGRLLRGNKPAKGLVDRLLVDQADKFWGDAIDSALGMYRRTGFVRDRKTTLRLHNALAALAFYKDYADLKHEMEAGPIARMRIRAGKVMYAIMQMAADAFSAVGTERADMFINALAATLVKDVEREFEVSFRLYWERITKGGRNWRWLLNAQYDPRNDDLKFRPEELSDRKTAEGRIEQAIALRDFFREAGIDLDAQAFIVAKRLAQALDERAKALGIPDTDQDGVTDLTPYGNFEIEMFAEHQLLNITRTLMRRANASDFTNRPFIATISWLHRAATYLMGYGINWLLSAMKYVAGHTRLNVPRKLVFVGIPRMLLLLLIGQLFGQIAMILVGPIYRILYNSSRSYVTAASKEFWTNPRALKESVTTAWVWSFALIGDLVAMMAGRIFDFRGWSWVDRLLPANLVGSIIDVLSNTLREPKYAHVAAQLELSRYAWPLRAILVRTSDVFKERAEQLRMRAAFRRALQATNIEPPQRTSSVKVVGTDPVLFAFRGRLMAAAREGPDAIRRVLVEMHKMYVDRGSPDPEGAVMSAISVLNPWRDAIGGRTPTPAERVLLAANMSDEDIELLNDRLARYAEIRREAANLFGRQQQPQRSQLGRAALATPKARPIPLPARPARRQAALNLPSRRVRPVRISVPLRALRSAPSAGASSISRLAGIVGSTRQSPRTVPAVALPASARRTRTRTLRMPRIGRISRPTQPQQAAAALISRARRARGRRPAPIRVPAGLLEQKTS